MLLHDAHGELVAPGAVWPQVLGQVLKIGINVALYVQELSVSLGSLKLPGFGYLPVGCDFFLSGLSPLGSFFPTGVYLQLTLGPKFPSPLHRCSVKPHGPQTLHSVAHCLRPDVRTRDAAV
jgi:hypothetical protein